MTDQVNDQEIELDDENEVMEAHDPKNAEQDAAKAVDKATEVTKQAPGRPGDKRNSEPMPKTKAGMLGAIYSKLAGSTKTDISSAYKNMFGEDAEIEFEGDVEALEENEVAYDYSGELDALVESEATLSEEFKEKTAVIFEAALKSKLAEEIDRLEEQYTVELNEELETAKSEMVEKVDGYLNYVVENWMEENKLAIQNGLRTEIAESFMDGLKTLFTESYIEVPESKVDLVDELAEQVEELEEKLNTTTMDAIGLLDENEKLKRGIIISESAKDLADTQKEKLAELAEDIDFENDEQFAKKVSIIKESYFAQKAKPVNTITEANEVDEVEETEISPMMEQYLKALKRI